MREQCRIEKESKDARVLRTRKVLCLRKQPVSLPQIFYWAKKFAAGVVGLLPEAQTPLNYSPSGLGVDDKVSDLDDKKLRLVDTVRRRDILQRYHKP